MEQEYDNTNRGVLFKNKRKEAGDKKPEYNGSLNVGGVEYFLDAWIKKSQAGETFMSVSVKRKDKQKDSAAPAKRPAPAGQPSDIVDFMDDSIPF